MSAAPPSRWRLVCTLLPRDRQLHAGGHGSRNTAPDDGVHQRLFTARGGEAAWGTTASLQGDHSGNGSVSMIWSGANLPGYGLTPGALAMPNFAFGLSALNSSGAIPYNFEMPGRELSNAVPSGQWFAEGSFTAAAIPAPGALGLLAIGGVVAARRRRR